MAERLTMLIEVIHSPQSAFRRNLWGPSYLVPLCVFGILLVVISYSQGPVHIQWTRLRLEAAGTPPDQIAASLEIMRRSNRLGVIFLPLFLGMRWALFALILWLTAQLFVQLLDFSRALTIVAYSYLPILARDAVACLVLSLRNEEALRGADGLNVALGLNLLFPQIPLPWSALAGNINLFEAWFVALLVIGVAAATKSRWQMALAIVLPNWLFVALVQLGFASLGMSLQNQLGRG